MTSIWVCGARSMMPALVPTNPLAGATSTISLPLTRGRLTPKVTTPARSADLTAVRPIARTRLPAIVALSARITSMPTTVPFSLSVTGSMLRMWLFSIETAAASVAPPSMIPAPQASIALSLMIRSCAPAITLIPAVPKPWIWLARICAVAVLRRSSPGISPMPT
ncbi:hypothetical protein ACVWXN_001230 [Bradyrhizobium sp. i1.4.4]